MRWFGRSRETTEHDFALERLCMYMDGCLTPSEKTRLEEHVATCRACRWELDTLRRTVTWTMELPRVPVPRVFTIPVPVRPVRTVSRPWALPVLQGATALVAVLFVLAVVGQLFVPSFFPAAAPQPVSLQQAPAAVQATAPAAAEKVVEVTVEVERQVMMAEAATAVTGEEPSALKAAAEAASQITEMPPPPAAETGIGGAEPTEVAAIATQMAEVAAMTAAPAGMGAGVTSALLLTATATLGAADLGEGADRPTATPSPTPTATDTPEPSPTGAASETPSPSPELTVERVQVEPTAVALVPVAAPPEEALAVAEDDSLALRRSVESGLGVAQIALGAAFVVLGLVTVAVMTRRMRRS